MRIKEVTRITGLSKKAIHYYIEEGLVRPCTSSNGYYDFSPENLTHLKWIHLLRRLNYSVDDIHDIITQPETITFFLIKHQKELQRKLATLQWQSLCNSELLRELDKIASAEHLDAVLKKYEEVSFCSTDDNIIDTTDAEMLAYYFWGNFMPSQPMTEYHRFLWERLKQVIVLNQTPDIQKLCRSLYSYRLSNIKQIIWGYELHYTSIADLQVNEYSSFVNNMVTETKRHLTDVTWVQKWKSQYEAAIKPRVAFFDCNASEIMKEISPLFQRYQTNIHACCALYLNYLESESGTILKGKLLSILENCIDLYAHHSGELAALYAFN